MSLEICAKVACGNSKSTQSYKVLKLKGNVAMATNLINTVKFTGTPFPADLDCVVDAKTFIDSYKIFKAPTVTKTDSSLKLVEGKTKAEIALSNTDYFPTELVEKDTSNEKFVSVEPKNFISAVDHISKFLAISTSKQVPEAYIIGNHIYVTNGLFLVRTPIDTEFPEQQTKPLTIAKDFVEILQAVKKPALEIKISEDSFIVVFEDFVVETARYAGDMPADFPSYFAAGPEQSALAPLPEDVVGTLLDVCALGDSDDVISFTRQGISLMKQGKVSFSIAYEMPSMFMMHCINLRTILTAASEFNFSDPKRVIFKGKDLEGTWAKYSAAQAAANPTREEARV
jgi:hypothetical protein